MYRFIIKINKMINTFLIFHPIKRHGFLFLCMLLGPKDPRMAEKGLKKKTCVTPLVGLMDLYTSEERGFFKCYQVQRNHVWRIRG